MSIVLLREPLTPDEMSLLVEDFPRYQFVFQGVHAPMTQETWAQVEVLYGSLLRPEELTQAHRLRWIHVPTSDTHNLCMHQIEENTNLLVTISKSTDVHHVGEFVLGTILSFAKNLFDWERLQATPERLENSPFAGLLWGLKGRQLLQIGLGITGTSITDYCGRVGMRVWGVQEPPSYHPHCQKIYTYHELNTLLPAADVVCVALPKGKQAPRIIGRPQLELMKQDSILIILRSHGAVDEEALAEMAPKGKFRGVACDVLPRDLGSKPSPLWTAPNVLLTPHVAPLPDEEQRLGFSLFRYNFRRYLREDFGRLRYLIDESAFS